MPRGVPGSGAAARTTTRQTAQYSLVDWQNQRLIPLNMGGGGGAMHRAGTTTKRKRSVAQAGSTAQGQQGTAGQTGQRRPGRPRKNVQQT